MQGVVEVRNAYGSAAHGADAYEPLLGEAYAEILHQRPMRWWGCFSRLTFVFDRHRSRAVSVWPDHQDFDEFIDENFGPFEIFDVPLIASEALFSTHFQAYRTQLVQFQQSQGDAGAPEGEGAELSESVKDRT